MNKEGIEGEEEEEEEEEKKKKKNVSLFNERKEITFAPKFQLSIQCITVYTVVTVLKI